MPTAAEYAQLVTSLEDHRRAVDDALAWVSAWVGDLSLGSAVTQEVEQRLEAATEYHTSATRGIDDLIDVAVRRQIECATFTAQWNDWWYGDRDWTSEPEPRFSYVERG